MTIYELKKATHIIDIFRWRLESEHYSFDSGGKNERYRDGLIADCYLCTDKLREITKKAEKSAIIRFLLRAL